MPSQAPPSQSQPHSEIQIADLMKPVKDLAQVWQIDIEPYIDGFVVEITNQLISDVDFREAALIIEQTSQLFAKKVDFLYEFVNQILIAHPGKEKRRRTTHVQANDLVLNEDYEDADDSQFASFYDIFNSGNPRVVNKTNLYLLPKEPYTMLEARNIIENSDIKISPVYNAIEQNNTLLLEEWDDQDLELALENNINIQPINYTTPVHPRYFEPGSGLIVSHSNVLSPQRIHQYQMVECVDHRQDEEEEDQIELLDGSNLAEETSQHGHAPSDGMVAVPSGVHEDEAPRNIRELAARFCPEELTDRSALHRKLSMLDEFINDNFRELAANEADDDDNNYHKCPFTRFKPDESSYDPSPGASKLYRDEYLQEIEDEHAELDDDLVQYFKYGEMFDNQKVELGISRRYFREAAEGAEQSSKAGKTPKEGASGVQPDLQLVDLNQLQPPPEAPAAGAPHASRRRAMRTRDYIRWVQRLEQQIARQTAFDVVDVRNTVLRNTAVQIDIVELSRAIAVQRDGGRQAGVGERVQLARCFIGSLFLASEGKVEFRTGDGGRLAVVQRK